MQPDEIPVDWTSVVLLERARGGDQQAAEAIFSRYFERLTVLARGLLSARMMGRIDPEDVVLSAYRSFFLAAGDGRFVLGRGGDLWRLLASITRHKLLRQVRHLRAQRRAVDREVALDQVEDAMLAARDQEPTAAEAVALADELEWVLAQLSPFGRSVLELRLQGTELSAIAAETGRSERTVRRTLDEVRRLIATRFSHD